MKTGSTIGSVRTEARGSNGGDEEGGIRNFGLAGDNAAAYPTPISHHFHKLSLVSGGPGARRHGRNFGHYNNKESG